MTRSAIDWINAIAQALGTELSTKNGYGFHDAAYRCNDSISDQFDIELLEEFGGEGEGNVYYYVFKIIDKQTDETVYIKFDGFYDSWNGTEWETDCFFVYPKQKTITVYVTEDEDD